MYNNDHRMKLVSETYEDDMNDIILNAGGVLYYISWWLMNHLTKVEQERRMHLPNFCPKIEQPRVTHKMMLQHLYPLMFCRSKKSNRVKLFKPCHNFFQFVCAIDAIFTTNISDYVNVLAYTLPQGWYEVHLGFAKPIRLRQQQRIVQL